DNEDNAREFCQVILESLPDNPNSKDQLQRIKETELMSARLRNKAFEEPWEFVKKYTGELDVLTESSKPEKEDTKEEEDESLFESLGDTVKSWMVSEKEQGQDNVDWEITQPQYKTELQESDEHGESLLVLVNSNEEDTKALANKLDSSTSNVFPSKYDERYQNGFFMTNPGNESVAQLKNLLEKQIN
ncbi:MAG: hypothetical protein ABEJ65_06015, partial [bacterium]